MTGVTVANITTLRNDDLYGKNATLVGWNVERDGDARFLRKANVQILTTTQCQERFQLLTNRPSEVPEGNLCTAADPFTISTEVSRTLAAFFCLLKNYNYNGIFSLSVFLIRETVVGRYLMRTIILWE